jgi:tRNA nucleotidyltransferase (CCA-adding enzyme)
MGFKLPEKVLNAMKKFTDPSTGLRAGEIYVVGGAVRDLMLGREVKDWDFTSNLTPEEMKKLFPKNSFCENIFGTFSIVLKNQEIFEVTTFRTERGYSDSRHPDEVMWGKTLKEDLQRRDFTINAMALDQDGNIYDYYEGQNDLKSRIIRAVGLPDERFGEDALRELRAIRIAAQIGFVIEEKTFE